MWKKTGGNLKELPMAKAGIIGTTINDIVVQLLSLVWLFVTLWTAACQTSLSFTFSWSLFKLMSVESLMLSNNDIGCSVTCRVWLFVTLWVVAHQAPLSMEFSKLEYWISYSLLQGIFLTQGSNSHVLYLLHCWRILDCWVSRDSQ